MCLGPHSKLQCLPEACLRGPSAACSCCILLALRMSNCAATHKSFSRTPILTHIATRSLQKSQRHMLCALDLEGATAMLAVSELLRESKPVLQKATATEP